MTLFELTYSSFFCWPRRSMARARIGPTNSSVVSIVTSKNGSSIEVMLAGSGSF
jgi:hypothetical protein